jgi:hypothetical protein
MVRAFVSDCRDEFEINGKFYHQSMLYYLIEDDRNREIVRDADLVLHYEDPRQLMAAFLQIGDDWKRDKDDLDKPYIVADIREETWDDYGTHRHWNNNNTEYDLRIRVMPEHLSPKEKKRVINLITQAVQPDISPVRGKSSFLSETPIRPHVVFNFSDGDAAKRFIYHVSEQWDPEIQRVSDSDPYILLQERKKNGAIQIFAEITNGLEGKDALTQYQRQVVIDQLTQLTDGSACIREGLRRVAEVAPDSFVDYDRDVYTLI